MLLALKRIVLHCWLRCLSVQETLKRYASLLMMLDSLRNIWSQHKICSWKIGCELNCRHRLLTNRLNSNRLCSYVISYLAIGSILLVLISLTDALQVLVRFWDRLLCLTSFWCSMFPVETTHQRLSRRFPRSVAFAALLRQSCGFSSRSRYLQFNL